MRFGREKSMMDRAHDYVDAVVPQMEAALETARDQAGSALHDARDKAAPALADARDRAVPLLQEAAPHRRTARHCWRGVLQAARFQAGQQQLAVVLHADACTGSRQAFHPGRDHGSDHAGCADQWCVR